MHFKIYSAYKSAGNSDSLTYNPSPRQGTSKPLTNHNNSGIAPSSNEITGTPEEIDSITTFGHEEFKLQKRNRSEFLIFSAIAILGKDTI